MATFILTWNPTLWRIDDEERHRQAKLTKEGGTVQDRWSLGVRRHGVSVGDRVFLLCQHSDRGLVASGTATSEIFEAEHWDEGGGTTTYVEVSWDTWLEVDEQLDIDILVSEVPEVGWNRLQGGGVLVPDSALTTLEELWDEHVKALGG